MEVILRTTTFMAISAEGMDQVETVLLDMNFKVPGVLYQGGLKILFYFILPYGIMATVPTQLLTGMLTPAGLLQAVGVVIGFTAFTLSFWRFGLRRYNSPSS